MKKIFATIMALLFAFGVISGCTGGGDSPTPTPIVIDNSAEIAALESQVASLQKTAEAAEAALAEATRVEEKEVFVPKEVEKFIYNGFTNPNIMDTWGDPISTLISQKTGVELVWEYPQGDIVEAVTLMIASDDYADLVSVNNQTLVPLVNAGALMPLRAKIEADPEFMHYYGEEFGKLAFSEDDDEAYAFGSMTAISREVSNGEFWESAWFIRMDHAKELEWPAINTLADLEVELIKLKEMYPTVNGQPTIPMSFATEGWMQTFGLLNNMLGSCGLENNSQWYYDKQTHEITAVVRRPEFKEFYRWMNHMNAIGMIDPEAFTQSTDMLNAKVAAGRVLCFMGAKWLVGEAYHTQRADADDGRGEDTMSADWFPYFPRLNSSVTDWFDMLGHGRLNGNSGWAIPIKGKDPQKIFDFCAFLASEEGIRLKSIGIEGIHYTIDSQNRNVPDPIHYAEYRSPVTNAENRNSTGVSKFPWFQHGDTWTAMSGIDWFYYVAPNDRLFYEACKPIQQEALDAYDILGFNRMIPARAEMTEVLYGSLWSLPHALNDDTAAAKQAYEDFRTRIYAMLILCDPAAYDATYDAAIAELESYNVALHEKDMTDAMAARRRMWGLD